MGISGLLPNLKSITSRKHISSYKEKRAAIDAYCLLHRGAYSCARELVEGEPSDKYINYCMSRIDLLIRNGVIPTVVFDGGRLPNKSDEERSRQRAREEQRSRARALWSSGNFVAAVEAYQRAVDISPALAKRFADALQRRGISFVIAPYEADAQMAYMAFNGLVDVVITEDSDLLAYGCPTVFFKMDKAGEGQEILLADLASNKELDFKGFTHDLFLEMCIMSGCDFVKSIPGIGIKKAHAHIRKTRSFARAIRSLRFDGVQVPSDYEKKFQRAIWTFRHQRVYCPTRKRIVHVTDLPPGGLSGSAIVQGAADLLDEEEDFLGPYIEDRVAILIAEGYLDPIALQPYQELVYSSGEGCLMEDDCLPSATEEARRPYKKPRHARPVESRENSVTVQPQHGNIINTYFKRPVPKLTQPHENPLPLKTHQSKSGSQPPRIETLELAMFRPQVIRSQSTSQQPSNSQPAEHQQSVVHSIISPGFYENSFSPTRLVHDVEGVLPFELSLPDGDERHSPIGQRPEISPQLFAGLRRSLLANVPAPQIRMMMRRSDTSSIGSGVLEEASRTCIHPEDPISDLSYIPRLERRAKEIVHCLAEKADRKAKEKGLSPLKGLSRKAKENSSFVGYAYSSKKKR